MALRTCSNPGPGVLLEYEPGGIPVRRAVVFAPRAAEFPRAGEVVREHHSLSYRLAPGRLHRDHPSPPVTGAA